MGLLAVALVFSDLVLAVLTFLWLARPEAAVGIVARLAGQHDPWLRGELSSEDEARLVWAAHVARGPLVAVLFLWSLVVGVVIGGARMI